MDVDAVEDDNDDDDDEHADGDGEERALQGRFVSGSFALTHMATDDVVAARAKEVHDAKVRKAAAAAAKAAAKANAQTVQQGSAVGAAAAPAAAAPAAAPTQLRACRCGRTDHQRTSSRLCPLNPSYSGDARAAAADDATVTSPALPAPSSPPAAAPANPAALAPLPGDPTTAAPANAAGTDIGALIQELPEDQLRALLIRGFAAGASGEYAATT